MKNILITGASGFIGSHLLEENIKKGNNVRALVLHDDIFQNTLSNKDVEIINGDIRDYETMKKAVNNIDIVYHCAALVSDWGSYKKFKEINVYGTENICKACLTQNIERFVYTSSNVVFGRIENKIIDESFPLSYWNEVYPDTKIDAEKIVWNYYNEKQLPVSIVYPCLVYGEGDQTYIPLLADSILKHELIFWRKNVLIWPTYIKNLIDFMMLISENERAIGNGFIIHDGQSTTLQKLSTTIAKTLNVPPIDSYLPYIVVYIDALLSEFVWKMLRKKTRPLLTTYSVKFLGSRFQYSIEKAKRELEWKPKIPYKTGLSNTMTWLKNINIDDVKKK